jgi:Mrp family chromosome partitioning ATPase
MDQLLEFVKEHYDCVFIDTPPINLVTDSSAFAQKSTGYILIVKSGVTDKAEIRASIAGIENIGGNILA